MQSRKIATCGVLCALAITVMMLGSMIVVGVYAATILAVWVLSPIISFYGVKAYLTAFFATAVIGLMIIPDRELILFWCCFGWWPAVRIPIERIGNKALKTALKLAVYFAAITAMIVISVKVLGIVYADGNGLLSPIPWLPIQLSVIDLTLVAFGSYLFMLLDRNLDKIRLQLTQKIKVITKIR